MILTITEESSTGKILNSFNINLETETITIRELIKERVFHEVSKLNEKVQLFQNNKTISTHEATLNNTAKKKNILVDHEEQLYIALDAFNKNAFFILVDNNQISELDEIIHVHQKTKINFIQLVPLIGG